MFITFDVGTTSVKTALYDRRGRLRRLVRKEYAVASPRSEWYEIDPEVYWSCVREGIQEILHRGTVRPRDIRGISGCSQGETTIFLDHRGRPVRPAILWIDKRCRSEADELAARFSREELYRVTGISEMDTTWSAPKILWVRRNEPDAFARAACVLLVEDYIVYRLTGEKVSSASLLSSSALIDIVKKRYWDAMVSYLGIEAKLPAIVGEGSVVGPISGAVAEELGLSPETMVVKGSMDQTHGVVGAGTIATGIVTETTGAALAIVSTVDRFNPDAGIRIPCQSHLLPGRFVLLPFAQSGGIMLSWFINQFVAGTAARQPADEDEGESMYEVCNREAAAVPPGSEGLTALPFIAGASYPDTMPFAKGVLYGLTLRHGKAHVLRAVMESVGYLLRSILSLLSAYGIPVREVRSTGGGARSDVWMRIKADICGLPFVRMVEEDAASLGAAVMAAVGLGEYPSVEVAVQEMVETGPVFSPDARNVPVYEKGYRLYRELYDRMKPLFSLYR